MNTVSLELRSIRRTRKLVNAMLWLIVAGAVFYSAMTSTPLVSAHSQWAWSGWVLGLLTDAAFVLALSADATLSKHGFSAGRWPVSFRWITGAASLFLNTWDSVQHRDWVGVAIHSISPAILVCAAEVAPIYRRAFRALEDSLGRAQDGVHDRANEDRAHSVHEDRALNVQSIPVHTVHQSPVHTVHSSGQEQDRATPVQSSSVDSEESPAGYRLVMPDAESDSAHTENDARVHSIVQSRASGDRADTVQQKKRATEQRAKRATVQSGDTVQEQIRECFLQGMNAAETARLVGRDRSSVSRQFSKLRAGGEAPVLSAA